MGHAFFPFDRIRDGQRLFLDDAVAALRGGAILLAHAPTGMGKTAVGLAAALTAGREAGATVFFLTSKHSQHRVAVDTLRRMRECGQEVSAVDVIAKQAMCLRPDAPRNAGAFAGFCSSLVRSHACAFYRPESAVIARAVGPELLHVQDLEKACRAFGVCPHKTAMEAARRCDVVIGDYNYLFSDIRDTVLGRTTTDLRRVIAVVDEAHNLPDRIRSQASADLRPSMLERAKRDAGTVDGRAARTLLRLAQVLRAALPPEETEVPPEFLGEILERVGGGESVLELAAVLEALGGELARRGAGAAVLQVAAFLRGWGRGATLRLARGGADPCLSTRLLDPSSVAAPVFAELAGGILMSGTLHPVAMYADLLGVPPKRRVIRSYPSPFDPSRRFLVASRRHTSAYAQRGPALYRGIAGTLAEVCKEGVGNAAAFFPSYGFTARVAEALRDRTDRPVLAENQAWTKEDRDAALRWLEDHRAPGGILLGVLGGGLSEGVDYRGNLLQVVFLVGLPLTPPTVETKALQRCLGAKFGSDKGFEYAVLAPAVSKILQAAGRPIRSETDRAAIVLLESRLLEPRYRALFPEEFSYRESTRMAAEVAEFLEAGAAAA
jgi:DNA excision repair protein ERCC-2